MLASASLSEVESASIADSDPIEDEVQDLLTRLGQATPEAQALFLGRILQGVITKSNPKISGEIVKAAQAQAPTQKTVAKPQPVRDARPIPWTGLGRITLHDPFDPIEGWTHFGHDVYWRILYYEMLPILEHILIHPNMPPGPKLPKKTMISERALAKAIIERLENHFGYKPS